MGDSVEVRRNDICKRLGALSARKESRGGKARGGSDAGECEIGIMNVGEVEMCFRV